MKATRAFVDSVDEGVALLIVGEKTVKVPKGMLPRGVGEGAWVKIEIEEIDAPEGAGKLRGRLGKGDPGGDFGL